MRIAYLADGKLWLKEADAPPRSFASPFAQTLQQQKEQTHQKRAWQKKSMMGGMAPPELVERMAGQEAQPAPVTIASVCSGGDGLFFALETLGIGALLTAEAEANSERRLFHTAEFQMEHLSHAPQHGLIACTLLRSDASRHIGILRDDGNTPDEVTEGDSVDMAPSWAPGAGRSVVFQSAGVARDADGYIKDRAPYSIEKLDLDSGEMTNLAQDEKHDFLAPRLLEDGTLLCIRRPYKSAEKPNFLKYLLSLILMPFWFIYAIFKWCSFFSWKYTGKQLSPEGGPKKEVAPSTLKAWGEMISPETMPKGRHNKVQENGSTAWVPKSWQLVRRKPNSDWETMAEHVLAYTLAPDGSLIYTDGGTIYQRAADGKTQTLHRAAAISELAIY